MVIHFIDFRTSKIPHNKGHNRKTEDISSICGKNESQYQIFQKRLQLLQDYIPPQYFRDFRNPCWYDTHKIPILEISNQSKQMHIVWKPSIRHVIETCDTPLSYNQPLAKFAIQRAKSFGKFRVLCLPSFFISGFSMCASTTLYRMIVQHPQIAEPKCEESHFWGQFVNQVGTDADKKMQILQYFNYFSPSIRKIKLNPGRITLDASVSYHTSNTESDFCVLPNLLKRVLPQAKFIVIMRNPSERVLLHYFHYLRKHFASQTEFSKYVHSRNALETFHHQTSQVIMRFQSCIDSGLSIHSCVRNKAIEDRNTKYYVGLQTSMYYYHLLPWLSIWPRKRFLFLRTEDLVNDHSPIMSKVWHFLHLTNLYETKWAFKKLNEHPKFPAHTKLLLDKFFQPHNELLANLLSHSKYLWKDM